MNEFNELTNGQGSVVGRPDALVKDIMMVAGEAQELAKEKIGEARTVIAEKARHAAGCSSAYVRTHPWQTIGMVALAGVILGFFVNRH